MQAQDICSAELFPLKKTDRCHKALELMNEWLVSHLPVVHDDKVIGYVSSEDIAFPEQEEDVVDKYLRTTHIHKVGQVLHLFDLLKVISGGPLTSVAVVDKEGKYTGIIRIVDLLGKLASLSTFAAPGSVISFQIPARDYSLSEISRIVESNDAKITGLLLNSVPDSDNRIEVLLKLNRADIRGLLAAFSRYNYEVRSETVSQEDIEYLKDRYDSFMRYLNI